MIRSVHMRSCLAAQIRFMLLKGPGSFKKKFKIGGNVDELKAYRLIPLTAPLPGHFTVPLKCQKLKNGIGYYMLAYEEQHATFYFSEILKI
jgi:hypothetical protein